MAENVWYVILCSVSVIVAYTRIHAGLHSIDQLLAGLLLGIFSIGFMKKVMKHRLDNEIDKLNEGVGNRFFNFPIFTLLSLTASLVFLYFYNTEHYPQPD